MLNRSAAASVRGALVSLRDHSLVVLFQPHRSPNSVAQTRVTSPQRHHVYDALVGERGRGSRPHAQEHGEALVRPHRLAPHRHQGIIAARQKVTAVVGHGQWQSALSTIQACLYVCGLISTRIRSRVCEWFRCQRCSYCKYI